MKHTIVLDGSQFTSSIPLSKREAKMKNQAGFFCVRQVYFTSKSWRRIWRRINHPFKHTFSHHVSGKRSTMGPLFIIQTSDRILFFFALFKPIILQFFTILQDKLHSFNIQDDRSTRFLCTTNYSIDHIIKRFREERMPALFS